MAPSPRSCRVSHSTSVHSNARISPARNPCQASKQHEQIRRRIDAARRRYKSLERVEIEKINRALSGLE
jgi:hypothetical protein